MLMSLPVSELKNYSLLTLTLPANFSYCIFVAVGSIFVIEWKLMRVKEAKRKFIIPPSIAVPQEDELNYSSVGHQRMVERFPQFLTLLLLGGLDSPVMSAVGGTIWVVENLVSDTVKEKSETQQYLCNAVGIVGWVGMVCATTKLALRLLQVI